MRIGMIGLGRMGGGMAARLGRAGHPVVGFDAHAAPAAAPAGVEGAGPGGVAAAAAGAVEGAAPAADAGGVAPLEIVDSLEALIAALTPPRVVWIMIPADALDATIERLTPLLARDDVLIDGGNSWYRDSMRRAATLRAAGIHFLDVGTSGGVRGSRDGYSLMIGGEETVAERLRPLFEALAPSPNAGWGHVGPSGAGHFVKMVHNGIEYGMMQAYAEGFALMDAKAELDLDPARVADIWRTGSVVRSWLLDLLAESLDEDASLTGVAPWVADSGEGRWVVAESIDLAVPTPVMTLALQARFRSRVENSYADRLLAVLRRAFGGHDIRPD